MTEELKNAITYLTATAQDRVFQAYTFAEFAHQGQLRKSGEPFIVHPLKVTLILAGLKQDADTLCAALLHDVLEDTAISPEKLKEKFGEQVLTLVEGVTKLTGLKLHSREEIQAENIRKMFLAMAKDIRIVFIKLADRTHNMRTLDSLPREKQIENARETMDVYAPLAHRLGLGLMKWELEDLAFRYLEPEKYWEIKEKVQDKRKEREAYITAFMEEIKVIMVANKIKGKVSGRAKHFYSIYRKMITQNLAFEDIYDLSALRILVPSEQDCYGLMGLIHAHWKPIQGKIKDYIAMPKENKYQSLHTTVIGPNGKQIEIQIRTFDMHHYAEFGVASHWLYKQTDKTKAGKLRLKQKDKDHVEKMSWLRQLSEEKTDGKEILDQLKTDALFDEVYVFSPKGDVYSLPQGSTPVDFAFYVHSEVGNRCVGAKINNKIVPLNVELHNGDIIEILTRKDATPKTDWLSFVKSPRTKAKIKSWITKQNKTEHLAMGRELLETALKELLLDYDAIHTEEYLKILLEKYPFGGEDDLLVAIGHGDVSSRAVARTLQEYYHLKHPATDEQLSEQVSKPRKSSKLGISVAGVDSIMLKVANCCHPVPGDAIIGFVTMGYGITVHRSDCRNISQLKERTIEVFWSNAPEHRYPTVIEVIGYDRVGMFKDLLNVVADQNTNVLEATAKKVGHGEFKVLLTVEVADSSHLFTLIGALKKVRDVADVYRLKS